MRSSPLSVKSKIALITAGVLDDHGVPVGEVACSACEEDDEWHHELCPDGARRLKPCRWNPSLQTGLANLQIAVDHQQLVDPGAPYLIEGYSQGAILVANEKDSLATMEAAGQKVPHVTIALFGSPNRRWRSARAVR